MTKTLSISRIDVEKTLKNKDIVLSDYHLQEQLLWEIFGKYPKNTDYGQVYLKVAMLNTFYSTGIQDVASVARNIVDNITNADKLMKDGDLTVVHRIALVNHGKNGEDNWINHFSFATKYCSFHYPKRYPIYDDLVYRVLSKLRKSLTTMPFDQETFKDKQWSEKKKAKCGYALYKDIYNRFVKLYATNFNEKDYKTVDRYLWGSRKIAGMADDDRRISGENSSKKSAFDAVRSNALNEFMNAK